MEDDTDHMGNEGKLQTAANERYGGQALDMADAEVILFPSCFTSAEADALFDTLRDTIVWQHDSITLYGRSIQQPRLTAWYGDVGKPYTYSGITMEPNPWTPELLQIRRRVEAVAAVEFNSVLLNLYRHERDSVSWHSDDEPELGRNPIIASVSFGATRRFQFKHKINPQNRITIELTHGSLLL